MGTATCVLTLFVVAWHGTRHNGFHFDDGPSITSCRAIRIDRLSVDTIAGAFRGSFLPFRNVASVTFAVDWYRGRGTPAPFLQTNLLLHAANALLVLLLLAHLSGGRVDVPAAAAAALFALHPIQVQAVTYIVQRSTLLATFFLLLGGLCYIRARTKSPAWLAVAAAAFAAASLSKPIAWIFPALLVVVELALKPKRRPLLLLSITAGLLSVPALLLLLRAAPLARFMAPYAVKPFTPWTRLLTEFRVAWFHASQIVLPLPSRFSLEHQFTLSRSLVDPPVTLPAIIATLVWMALGIKLLLSKAGRTLGLFLLFVPLTMAIEGTILPLDLCFEHRLYLPMAGVAGIAALLLRPLYRGRHSIAVAAVLLLLLAALAIATNTRTRVWRTDVSLWEDAVRSGPASARSHNNLGEAYHRASRPRLALREYRQAVRIDPRDVRALANLARSLQTAGHKGEALHLFERAELLAPENAHIHFSKALLFVETGRFESAVRELRLTLMIDPAYPQAALFLRFAEQRLKSRDAANAAKR